MPGRILVADDIPTSRFLTRTKLSMAYYDVIEAGSGHEALEVARREEPDMVLLEVAMSGVDGFETCRRLKADTATAHIPIIMLTTQDRRDDRVRALEAGADDFLTKPFDDAALLTRVSSLTRMKMMIDELRLRTCQFQGPRREPALPGADLPNYAGARILLIGAEPPLAEEIGAQVRHHLGAAIETARGLAEARRLLATRSYDVFIIGTDPPDGEPMRIASVLRGRPQTRQAALLMLFRPEDTASVPLALEMGVCDHILLPPDYAEMAARLRAQIRRKHYSDQLRESVESSIEMAVTDPLTGLYNRRFANARLQDMLDQATEQRTGLAAMLLDLDDFKMVNDRYGHPAGDAVLIEFAQRLRRNVRGDDLVARIGGEEFLVVMPDIQPEAAARVAERVRGSVEVPAFRISPDAVPVTEVTLTVSIGLALHGGGESASDLVARADRALYESKAAGRNTVTMAAA